jgi:hypothetical protein
VRLAVIAAVAAARTVTALVAVTVASPTRFAVANLIADAVAVAVAVALRSTDAVVEACAVAAVVAVPDRSARAFAPLPERRSMHLRANRQGPKTEQLKQQLL